MNQPTEEHNEQEHESTPQKKPVSASTREQEFNEAVERVYRKYGNNLSAFYRDAQKEQLEKRG